MSLMENTQYVDEQGNPVEVDETRLETAEDGSLTFNGVKVKKVESQTSAFPENKARFKDPSNEKPSDTKEPEKAKEPEKPSTPEVPQPNVDPSGLANQAGPGAAAMANQLAQAGVGAGGQPSQSGGVNLNFANMFAGQFAKGPVNVGGNQQVSSGSGAQTMNFGTMASGNAVVAGGGISNSNIVSGNSNSNTAIGSKVASGLGKIDSGNTSTTSTTTNTNSGNTTNTNSGNTTTNRNVAIGGSSIGVNTKPAPTKSRTPPYASDDMESRRVQPGYGAYSASNNKYKPQKVAANENFQLKVNQTLNEMTRLFGRKDGGLRKS